MATHASADCLIEHDANLQNTPMGKRGTDVTLLNRAFLAEINARRCEYGLGDLAYDAALEAASQYHSNWMVESSNFAHQSSVPGMLEPADRATHFGYSYRIIAENLAAFSRYDFRDEPFFVYGECEFKRENGASIAPITIAGLASQVTEGWMNSLGHRQNILIDETTEAAVAVQVDLDAEHCGRIYVTMLYGAPLE